MRPFHLYNENPILVRGRLYIDTALFSHDDVIKWKHFPRYWPFVSGIHRSPVNSPHKGQWHGALMFSLISAWINAWINNRDAVDLRRHRAHYDVILMYTVSLIDYMSLVQCPWMLQTNEAYLLVGHKWSRKYTMSTKTRHSHWKIMV